MDGLLCHGFVRVCCGDCNDERLIAFSRKTRGFCYAQHEHEGLVPPARQTGEPTMRCLPRIGAGPEDPARLWSGVILPQARSVTLRLFTPEDARAVFVLSQQPGMREWLPDQVYADEAGALATMDALIASYAVADPRRAPLVLAVCRSELVGHVGLSAARGAVEIGYAIDDAHRGKGLATDAVRAMADWGLRTFALPHIDGIVAADNVASCRVLERAGFDLVQETARPLHGKLRLVRGYRFSDTAYVLSIWGGPRGTTPKL